MARWKLTAKHYLNVPGTEWEYEETNRDTGKRFKKKFAVPQLLDPDSSEFTNRDGDLIVAYEGTNQKGDVVFLGPPTPDMEPLDEEAEALSAKMRPNWQHPIESLPAQGVDYSQSLLTMLERQMSEAMKNLKPTVSTPATGIDPTEFEELKRNMAMLMARNAELEAAAEGTPAKVARRA